MSAPTVHATALLLGSTGVLLRGRSGAGKTRLALALVAAETAAGGFARLVADDRVVLAVAHGRLVARPPAALAGLAERRGEGVLAVAHEPAAVLGFVVDLVPDAPERVPAAAAGRVEIDGVGLPRLVLPEAATDLVERVRHFRDRVTRT